MNRSISIFLCLCGLAAVPSAAGQVWVVAPAAGAGIDFTNLQTALTVAGNGDTLLIKSGTYATGTTVAFSLSGKGLTLVEDAGATVVLGSTLSINNLGAGQQVCLRGISVASADVGTALSLFNCAGLIWIEDGSFVSSSSLFPFTPAGSGLIVSSCAAVTAARCTFTGATILTSLGTGLDGVVSTSSSLALYDCACNGGNVSIPSNGSPLLVGGDGAEISGGFLYASGTSFKGGKGGPGTDAAPFSTCSNGAPGGNGLHLGSANPAASTLACSFLAGAGGAGGTGTPGCTAGPNGAPIKVDTGAHTQLAGTAHSLACNATCREGQTFTLTYTGAPGELAFIDLSGLQNFLYFPDFRGVLVLGFPIVTIFQGTLPATGTLVKTSGVINDLGPATEGITLYLQAAFASAADGIYQAGPSATVLLDASF